MAEGGVKGRGQKAEGRRFLSWTMSGPKFHPSAFILLPLTNSFGQNRHDFVRPAGRDRLAPVVGFGVVQLVQVFDGGADGAEAAKN